MHACTSEARDSSRDTVDGSHVALDYAPWSITGGRSPGGAVMGRNPRITEIKLSCGPTLRACMRPLMVQARQPTGKTPPRE